MGAEDKDFKPRAIGREPSGTSAADALLDNAKAKAAAAKPRTDIGDANLARARAEGWGKSS